MATVKLLFSGHKPERLCGSFSLKNKTRTKVRTFIQLALKDLKRHYDKDGTELEVLTSLNLGVDTDVAAMCLSLNIPYSVYLVGTWQANKWVKADKGRYQQLLTFAKRAWICDKRYHGIPKKDLYAKRDEKMMLDCSSAIMIFDGVENGGTYHKINTLKGFNKPIEVYSPVEACKFIDKHKV